MDAPNKNEPGMLDFMRCLSDGPGLSSVIDVAYMLHEQDQVEIRGQADY